jgi:hypothetical protein
MRKRYVVAGVLLYLFLLGWGFLNYRTPRVHIVRSGLVVSTRTVKDHSHTTCMDVFSLTLEGGFRPYLDVCYEEY